MKRTEKRRKALIVEAYDLGHKASTYDALDSHDEVYLSDFYLDVKLPSWYLLLLSVVFFPPVGVLAIYHAKKGTLQALYTPYGVRNIMERSNQSYRYATLAIIYGFVFWTAVGIVFGIV